MYDDTTEHQDKPVHCFADTDHNENSNHKLVLHMYPPTRQLKKLHLSIAPEHYLLYFQEDTKLGIILNNHTGLPPTFFTKAYKEYFRGFFRIVLRDALKEPEITKREALLVSISIYYVFFHGNKGCIQSYDHIHDFIKYKAVLTRREIPIHSLKY